MIKGNSQKFPPWLLSISQVFWFNYRKILLIHVTYEIFTYFTMNWLRLLSMLNIADNNLGTDNLTYKYFLPYLFHISFHNIFFVLYCLIDCCRKTCSKFLLRFFDCKLYAVFNVFYNDINFIISSFFTFLIQSCMQI